MGKRMQYYSLCKKTKRKTEMHKGRMKVNILRKKLRHRFLLLTRSTRASRQQTVILVWRSYI